MSLFRNMYKRVRLLSDRPFATAMGMLLVSSTTLTLAGIGLQADVLEPLVPGWLITGLAVSYGLGGLFLLAGMMFQKGNLEAAGCVLILSGLAVRAIALLTELGFSAASLATVFYYVVFGGACIERIRQILGGDQIIRVHKPVEIRFEVDDDSS